MKDTEQTLRKAYAPVSSAVERDAGRRLVHRIIKVLARAAKENPGWLVEQLRGAGMGRTASAVVMHILARL